MEFDSNHIKESRLQMIERGSKRSRAELKSLTKHLSDLQLALHLWLAQRELNNWLRIYGCKRHKITRQCYNEHKILLNELRRRMIEKGEDVDFGSSLRA